MQQSGAKTAPAEFNPGAPKQMAWMVFDRLKLKPRIKKGKSTDKDILKSIENPPALVTKVLEYRAVQKEHSTYVIGLLDARDTDGRVRTTFNLHVTATGRLSSKEPNVQNQPAAHGVGNIRKAFIAKPGYILGEMDYSSAELRWMAFLSHDKVLTEIFKSGRNLHKETATKLFGPHYTPQQKMRAKAVNFGIPYGREAASLAQEFNISIEEAEAMLNGWLNAYPQCRDYLKWCADQVALGNYLETPWGRRRRFGLVTPIKLHDLQNEAKNFPIQSASSDTLLWSAMKAEKRLKDEWDVSIIDLIHDSVLMEFPADPHIIQAAASYMNSVMVTTPIDLFQCEIPFKTDFEIGVNWGDLSGTEFDYKMDPLDEVVHIENDDDSITNLKFYDWYHNVTTKVG
jgi:DNA polymerase-1